MRPATQEPKASRFNQAEAERRAQDAEARAALDKAWSERDQTGRGADMRGQILGPVAGHDLWGHH